MIIVEKIASVIDIALDAFVFPKTNGNKRFTISKASCVELPPFRPISAQMIYL